MEFVRTIRRKVAKNGNRLILGLPGEMAEDLGITEEMSVDWHKVVDDNGQVIKGQAFLTFTKNGDAADEDKEA
ncbi:MAG: hypothetical protein WBP42_00640 [Candidatus Zixiibacteriota bacterium]